jgi:hypothetical protein
MYERAQQGLLSRGTDWINVARLFDAGEYGQLPNRAGVTTNGTNEWQMRNQMRSWVRYMTATMKQGAPA